MTFGNWFWPSRRRQLFSAASASLKIMASAVLFERHPLERTVRWRTVANELSMTFVVRKCFQRTAVQHQARHQTKLQDRPAETQQPPCRPRMATCRRRSRRIAAAQRDDRAISSDAAAAMPDGGAWIVSEVVCVQPFGPPVRLGWLGARSALTRRAGPACRAAGNRHGLTTSPISPAARTGPGVREGRC